MQIKQHPQSDFQGKVADIIWGLRWASASSGELHVCCQAPALVMTSSDQVLKHVMDIHVYRTGEWDGGGIYTIKYSKSSPAPLLNKQNIKANE